MACTASAPFSHLYPCARRPRTPPFSFVPLRQPRFHLALHARLAAPASGAPPRPARKPAPAAQPKRKKPPPSLSSHPPFGSKAPVPAAPRAQRQRPFHIYPRVLAAARRTPSFSFSLLRQPCSHFALHVLPASPCKGTYPPGRTGFRSAAPPRAETRHPPHSPNAKSPGLPALPIHDARTLPSGLRLPVHPARTAAVPAHAGCMARTAPKITVRTASLLYSFFPVPSVFLTSALFLACCTALQRKMTPFPHA